MMTGDDGGRPDRAGAAFLAAWQEGMAAHLERMEPLAELLLEAAQVPLDPGGGHRPCWCPCGKAHPGDFACDMEAVTTRRIGHVVGEWADIPVCGPCAVAQAVAASA